jgi:hypothetical protein
MSPISPQQLAIQFAIEPKAVEYSAVPFLPLTHAFRESLHKIASLATDYGLELDYETVRMEVRPERDLLLDTGVQLQMRTTVMTK